MDSILTVARLKKDYGQLHAVRGISFAVQPGEILALIGPNGAGKSTTLKMVATLLTPTGGEITLAGTDAICHPDLARRALAYLPEEAGAYKNLTGLQYLQFMAGLYADSVNQAVEYVERATSVASLGARLRTKVGTYSKGMTRKLLLARTMMTRPQLAILDEPTSGLDVLNALDIRQTIRALTKDGAGVLLSSHNMLEIEFLADRVAIIDQGKIHETGTTAELKKKYHANNLEEVFAKVAA